MKFYSPLLVAAVIATAGCVADKTEKSTASSGSNKAMETKTATTGKTPAGKVDAEGYTVIFDGDWANWRVNENPKAWTIVDNALRACGDRSHCFYVGPLAPFKDFDLKLDIKTEPGSNGGVYIHTKYLDSGWPWGGYETQVNQTQGDWRKSGSIYLVKDLKEEDIKNVVKDGEWYTHRVVVKGNNIKVYLNGKLVNDFTEEPGRQAGKDFERKLNEGTFALQAHDPKSVVMYKNIRVKKL